MKSWQEVDYKEPSQILVAAGTNVGGRSRNEDNFFGTTSSGIEEVIAYAGVYDGIGGHANGHVASASLQEGAKGVFLEDSQMELDDEGAASLHALVLSEGYRTLRERVGEFSDSGTTYVAAVVYKNKASNRVRSVVGHVGDSRAYLSEEDGLKQLTEDHSYVNKEKREIRERLERKGLQGDDLEAAFDQEVEERNNEFFYARAWISRFLIARDEDPPEADYSSSDMSAGQVYLFCSDGLTDFVDDEKIQEIVVKEIHSKDQVGQDEVQGCVDALIEEALDNNTGDNVTVAILYAA